MAAAQQLMHPSAISNLTVPSRDTLKIDGIGDDQFPAGLRVLVVDDDPICLLILDRLLRQCRYEVTTCGKATTALKMLRENRSKFDLVISDVVMPDMDGFKLLELVGLEMDLPVIMMSANGETSAVMKGITHGACDYLLKPVRIEELKNIWQHVVRKKKRDSELSPACRDEKLKRELQDGDHVSSMNDCLEGASRLSKKRKDIKEEAEDVEQDNEDGLSTRKPRVVWSVELHQQFVAAVNQLGIDKAVPKRILELMNVPNLTRENIASHLQKYRLYLKRISGVTQQPGGLNASFLGGSDPSFCAGSGGLGDFHTFAATGQLVPHSLMLTSQLGLLGQLGTSSNMSMVGADPSLLLKLATLQGASNNQLGMLHYDASVLGGSQRNSPQAFSSGPDLKPLAQGALPLSAFPQLGEPVEKGQIEISTIQPPTAGAGLNCGQQRTGVNSNSSFHASKNNALMMQMLQPQRRPSAQLTSADMLCLPSVELLGQHMLSNDLTNTKYTVPPSTVIGPSVKNENAMNIQIAGEATVGSGSLLSGASSYSPSTLNMLGRTLGADTTALHLNEETRNVSPSLPAGFGRELDATGIKVLDSASIGIIQTPSMMGSDLSSFMESKNGSHNTHGWQRLKVGQDMGQTLTPIISPRYTQSMSCGPGLNRTRQQEEGQGQRHSIDENMIVSVLGGRPLKPSMSNFPPLREHSMASMEMKMKNTSSNLLVQSKEELGFLSEPFSSSDELLNLIFKQQRGSGFMEADLSAGNFSDGYEIKSS